MPLRHRTRREGKTRLAARAFKPCWRMIRRGSLAWTLTVAMFALTAASQGWSDQSGPRLSGLFAQLRTTPSAEAAQPIETQTWDI